MKSYRRRNTIIWLSLILMLITSLVAVGCGSYNKEPFGDLIIENQTDQALKITVNDYKMGEVKPGDRIMRNNVYMVAQYIDARDEEGEVVFSEIYSLRNNKYRLQKIEEGLYKAVIPPLQDYSPSPRELPVGGGIPLFSLIIENQTDKILTIYYGAVVDIATNQVSWANKPIGDVSRGQQITIKNLSLDSGWYPIKATDEQGEIVFSEIYTFKTKDKYHLQEIEERLYKAVIPPLGNRQSSEAGDSTCVEATMRVNSRGEVFIRGV